MRGHVRKRGARWCVVVDVGRDPDTGRRIQKWHSGFVRKRDAESAVSAIVSKLEDGSYVEPSKLTVGRFLTDEWLPAIRATIGEGTLESYARNVRAHIVPAIGGVPLQRLTPAHLNAMYADLLESGRSDGGGGLSPRTVRYCHTIVRRSLQAAVKWGRVVRNVADAAEPPSPKVTRAGARQAMRTWTADELRGFLAAQRETRDYPLWVVLAQTGMRRGEVLGARWSDLDLEAGRWSVRRTLTAVAHELRESEPKTDHGRRSVALDAGTARVLGEWRRRQLEERLALGPAWQDTGRVFTREDGADLHPERVSERFDRLVGRSGPPRIRLHDLRHTHATLALAANVHPKVVSERLGHASVTITLDTYSHAIPAMQADAAGAVAALVGLD